MHKSTRGTSASRSTAPQTMSSSYGYNYNSRVNTSTTVKSSEPLISVEAHFSTNIKSIHSLLPGFQNKVSEKIKHSFNSYMRVDGRHARSLFSIGFLLVQEIVSQGSAFDARARQKFLLSSMSSFVPYLKSEQSQKTLFVRLHSKLETFFLFSGRFRGAGPSSLDDPAEAARFICDECKKDKDLAVAIVYMARCALGESMVKDGINRSMPMIFSKLTNPAWESEDQYAEELYKVLSMCFNYTVNLFSIKETSCNEKVFANGNNVVNFLDYSSRVKEFKAILYKSGESEPSEKSTNVTNISSQESSILSRNKNRIEERDTSNSLLSNSSKMSTGIKLEPQNSISEVDECSLCGQEILKHLIYTNPGCGHNYCYYCLQDIVDSHSGLKYCYLKKCPRSMNPDEIKKFYKQRGDEERAKPSKIPSMHGVPEEGPINQQPSNITTTVTRNNRLGGEDIPVRLTESSNYKKSVTCSCCDQDVNEHNPIVYTNERCGHTFCKGWFILNKPSFDGNCYKNRCLKEANFEKVKEALQRHGTQSFPVRCSKCAKVVDSQKIFLNSCDHVLCVSCTDKIESIFCPLSSCPGKVDEEKLLLWRGSLMSEGLEQKTVICPSCNHQVTFFSPGGSKSEYWKCPDCSKMFCSQHNDTMSKCLCLCPKCLGNLNDMQSQNVKECQKCSIWYCQKCGKENKARETCACSIPIPTSNNVSTAPSVTTTTTSEQKNGKISFTIDTAAKAKVHPNTCSLCNDFRDTPEYLRLACGHKICELCVIIRREDFAKAKVIKCILCPK